MKKKNLLLLLMTIVVSSGILMLTFVATPGLQAANDSSGSPSLPNPLGKNVDITDVMLRIIQVALAAVDIFALFMFILGGFELLVSGGNPKLIQKAKDTLIWATIGIVVITLSYSVLKFIFERVKEGL